MFGLLQRSFGSVIINGHNVSCISVPPPKHRGKGKANSLLFSFFYSCITIIAEVIARNLGQDGGCACALRP